MMTPSPEFRIIVLHPSKFLLGVILETLLRHQENTPEVAPEVTPEVKKLLDVDKDSESLTRKELPPEISASGYINWIHRNNHPR